MTPPRCLIALLAMLLLTMLARAEDPQPLWSFESPADVAAVKSDHVTVRSTRRGVTHGQSALEIEFGAGDWPSARLLASPGAAWDFSASGGLRLDVTNPEAQPVSLSVRIDDDAKSNGNDHARTGSATIDGGKTQSIVLALGPDPMSLGMRGLPPHSGARAVTATGKGAFDLHHIVAIHLFLNHPREKHTLIIDNVRLEPAVQSTLGGIVDPFGQYAKADWPGKIKSLGDLAAARKAEEAGLHAHPDFADRDQYGGWSQGPSVKATGFFRSERIDNKWWLVDPDGRLFLSVGPCSAQAGIATITTGRESMFQWLPTKSDPLGKHLGYASYLHSGPVKEGATFDFYAANLHRKYGDDYATAWVNTTVERLRAWGFNTLANWHDPRLRGADAAGQRVAYTVTAGVGGQHLRVRSGHDYWRQMHDPFDPEFAADARRSIASTARQAKDDPWCIGYFVDNEESWGGGKDADYRSRYGLAYGALSLAGTASPAKAAFLGQLKQKYSDVQKLNAAWATRFKSWQELDAPFEPTTAPSDAMRADLSAYLKAFALKYFTVVRDALRAVDTNHLYLGCRFAWKTPEAVEAAGEICGVVSFNIYQRRLDAKDWSSVEKLNKPCIIGEFHFGALDRGMFHPGLVATKDQAERAATYIEYVRSVVDHPSFVGCHWFQYTDEPLTGRSWDGENYNIGLVTITDTPYPELIDAAKKVHAEMYPRRQGQRTGKGPG